MSGEKRDRARWVELIPELATRPNLVQAMMEKKRIRARVFNAVEAMESIALIPSRSVVGQCLSLYWRQTKQDLYYHWHDKLRSRTGTDQLFNEMFGCIRNVFYDVHLKAGLRPPMRHGGESDVVRQYR